MCKGTSEDTSNLTSKIPPRSKLLGFTTMLIQVLEITELWDRALDSAHSTKLSCPPGKALRGSSNPVRLWAPGGHRAPWPAQGRRRQTLPHRDAENALFHCMAFQSTRMYLSTHCLQVNPVSGVTETQETALPWWKLPPSWGESFSQRHF